MTDKAQVIFANGKPAFVVIPYDDYVVLAGAKARRSQKSGQHEFVPFVLDEFIRNPIRVLRIEAELNQSQLAKRLGVSQGYVSRIEGRNYKASDRLLARIRTALKRK